MDAKVKVTVNLPAATVEKLRGLARANGTTVTEMLRRAIATEAFIAEQMAAHRKILIEAPDGQLRELAFR